MLCELPFSFLWWSSSISYGAVICIECWECSVVGVADTTQATHIRCASGHLQCHKIQTHWRFKGTLFIRKKHNLQIFGGNPLYQATKWYLTNLNSGEKKRKKRKKWKMRCNGGTLFIRTKTQSANVQGNPLCEATKWHLHNS